MPVIEIRWHGRGGQGGVTSAELLAKAAYYDGYKGVQAFPYFGAERRGAPVKAFTRISDEEIHVRSQIYEPDIVAVLDPGIIDIIDVTEGLKPDGKIIINTPKRPDEFSFERGHVYTYDGTGIALKYGLLVAGLPVVNTTMLGAFAKATGLVKLETVQKVIMEKWPGKVGEKNAQGAKEAYDTCTD
ncbi:MAG: pyruvate ferredoxin oxidoreductase subunit gamma [Candidatus Thorarchaeota archaeon]|nr:MAG: pyruvate ferredoxin oxidoreductase [Candidatus Thorarchaeota archaeon]RLI58678.1 MAG: pyruvate ferredoxin oxidoreductase [Candidatus Thorarchaeota archaeon]